VSKESDPAQREASPVWASTSEPAHAPPPARGPASEKVFVYIIVAAIIVFILVAVGWFSIRAVKTYDDAANASQAAYTDRRISPQDSLTYRLVFARAQDATLVKGGALLLSFLVVILGVLMVLEGSNAFYKLNIEGAGKKSALETSSPGLVMITLGLALVYGVMMYKTEFSLSASSEGQTWVPLPADETATVRSEPAAEPRDIPPQTAPAPVKKEKELPASEKAQVAVPAPEKTQVSVPVPQKSQTSPVPGSRLPDLQQAASSALTQRMPESRMDVRIAGLQDQPSAGPAPIPELATLPFGAAPARQEAPDGGAVTPRKTDTSLSLDAGPPLVLPQLPLLMGASKQ